MHEQQSPYLAERYQLIGQLKQFWRANDDQMGRHVDLDGLAMFIRRREIGAQGYGVLELTRNDVAMAFTDEDDNEPDWPYTMSDGQMAALALRIQQCLTSDEPTFWDAIRDCAHDMALVGNK
jgi:hypothetical protein